MKCSVKVTFRANLSIAYVCVGNKSLSLLTCHSSNSILYGMDTRWCNPAYTRIRRLHGRCSSLWGNVICTRWCWKKDQQAARSLGQIERDQFLVQSPIWLQCAHAASRVSAIRWRERCIPVEIVASVSCNDSTLVWYTPGMKITLFSMGCEAHG